MSCAICTALVFIALPLAGPSLAEPLSTEQEKALKPGHSFKECKRCPEMVVVSAGSFLMGSPQHEKVGPHTPKHIEEPQHEVTIAKPFAVGKFEVTGDEFQACLEDDACRSWGRREWPQGRRPVTGLTWYMAQDYIGWLKRKTGKPYRLLSEAEWEYVARAGTTTPYYTGNTITTEQARFSNGVTAEAEGSLAVGQFPPNPFGLHDMVGNIAEWVEDCYNETYDGAPSDGSPWLKGNCEIRMARGSSWVETAPHLRSAERRGGVVGRRYSDVGFRVARTLTP